MAKPFNWWMIFPTTLLYSWQLSTFNPQLMFIFKENLLGIFSLFMQKNLIVRSLNHLDINFLRLKLEQITRNANRMSFVTHWGMCISQKNHKFSYDEHTYKISSKQTPYSFSEGFFFFLVENGYTKRITLCRNSNRIYAFSKFVSTLYFMNVP